MRSLIEQASGRLGVSKPDWFKVAYAYHRALTALRSTLRWDRPSAGSSRPFFPFRKYPKDCCRWASQHLGLHIFEHYAVNTFVVGCPEHVWLETESGIAIDITCGQFADHRGDVPFVGNIRDHLAPWCDDSPQRTRESIAEQFERLRELSQPAYSDIEAFLVQENSR